MPSPMRWTMENGITLLRPGYLDTSNSRPESGEPAAPTVKLDREGEPQPDHLLLILPGYGGQSHVDAKRYLVGPPELVVEIARATRYYDLNRKKSDYERAGVQEYLVVELDPNRIHWFIRRGNHFQELLASPDGLHRSEVFPGLWLDTKALFARDWESLYRAVRTRRAHARARGVCREAGQGARPDAWPVLIPQFGSFFKIRTSSWSIFWTRCLATKTWPRGFPAVERHRRR